MPTLVAGRVRPALLLLVCAVSVAAVAGVTSVVADSGSTPSKWGVGSVAEIVASLSDEELVGQVLMPYVYGAHATEVSEAAVRANRQYAGVATPAELVERYRVGGVILLGHGGSDETNVSSPAQVNELTSGLQAAAAVPLLIGIDQEYGVVARLRDGVTNLPSAMAAGAAGDPELTEAAWRVAGTELAAMGVNVNFAPVADVLGKARGGVIGSRSYGSDPELVSAQVAAVVRGLQDMGVAATLKHFPGHGDTTVDSHYDLPVLDQSLAQWRRNDLPPFVAGVEAGSWLAMLGHLDMSSVDPGVPATFSHPVVTGLLRDELGFEGVVVTDALNMAPAQRWSAGEAAVKALLAGNDLLLMPPDLAEAQRGLLAALADGDLPRERLADAATRVVTLKQRLAEHSQPEALSDLDTPAHHEAVAPLAAAAITLLRGPCEGPLVDGPVTVTTSSGRDHTRAWLAEALTDAGVEVVDSGGVEVHLVGFGDERDDLNPDAAVTVAMDVPYLLERSDSPVLVATYSSSRPSLAGLAQVIAGHNPARGRPPVPLRDLPTPAACDSA